ncbi:protein of unknown function DUF29 [Stanieria cyanosphaera PCC 7437]|uniref:DUF29 family protein n=1 Tax=Stanieria cyanosphaera (strain ATCC 29371 / PCC 7437) TaxID=111780 RepID=K9Y1D8_STAC7|nr:DUF29 family protein [Stanieria cyanosphaera]AFZ37792.1 protein of unknown function DUF29 [Stanieria cyanosphaera PCC 7437]
MVQELIDLRQSIVEGRYQDALEIVDELEGMGKQAILRNLESFLVRLLIHLIKNQVEKRLTNSWAASISDSVRQIKKLNLKDNKKSYYIDQDNWSEYLEEAFEVAILEASIEVCGGTYTPIQLEEIVDKEQIIKTASSLINFSYQYSTKDLLSVIREYFINLPGGKEWLERRI